MKDPNEIVDLEQLIANVSAEIVNLCPECEVSLVRNTKNDASLQIKIPAGSKKKLASIMAPISLYLSTKSHSKIGINIVKI